MTALEDYSVQSTYSDPGRYAELLDGLPTDVAELAAVVQNVLIHYRAGDQVHRRPTRRGGPPLDRAVARDGPAAQRHTAGDAT